MNVKLISVTAPRIEGVTTAEDLVVYTARASSPNNQLNMETGPKLLKYLITHEHWSPFEQVSLSVEVVTSRAIAAQILRHRSMTYQETSQRYATSELGFEFFEGRLQAASNRQSSTDGTESDQEFFSELQSKVFDFAARGYQEALGRGIAREQARALLPLATRTRLYMQGTLRSFLHYTLLRTKPDTQKEHRDVAEGIKQILCTEFPHTSKAIGWLP